MAKDNNRIKFKWEVDKPPTGLARVCYRRRWPTAYYSNDRICATIGCSVDYHIQIAKSGDHPPLEVRLANHSVTPWKWVSFTAKFNTLQDAKDVVKDFLRRHPEFMPKGEE